MPVYVHRGVDPSYLVLPLSHDTHFGSTGDFPAPSSDLQFQSSDQADKANPSIWVGIAICGGGKVIKVSPEANVVGEISIPKARMISCPAFVDEDLFITSAEEEEPEKYPDSVKLGGSLFKVHCGVKGMPVHKFKRR